MDPIITCNITVMGWELKPHRGLVFLAAIQVVLFSIKYFHFIGGFHACKSTAPPCFIAPSTLGHFVVGEATKGIVC